MESYEIIRDRKIIVRTTPAIDDFLDVQAQRWGIHKATLAAYAVAAWCNQQRAQIEALENSQSAMLTMVHGMLEDYMKNLEDMTNE